MRRMGWLRPSHFFAVNLVFDHSVFAGGNRPSSMSRPITTCSVALLVFNVALAGQSGSPSKKAHIASSTDSADDVRRAVEAVAESPQRKRSAHPALKRHTNRLKIHQPRSTPGSNQKEKLDFSGASIN